MPTTEWIIQGMRDEHCLRLVTNTIQDLPGIGCLEISLDTGAASVEHSTVVSDAEVRAAVEEAGYTPG
jgi:copper chaperone